VQDLTKDPPQAVNRKNRANDHGQVNHTEFRGDIVKVYLTAERVPDYVQGRQWCSWIVWYYKYGQKNEKNKELVSP
jgi:hypothetical protein